MPVSHTPGPWAAKPPDGGKPVGCDLVDLMSRSDLQSDYWFIAGPGADVHGHMSEADARLIAAAPDLLCALQELLAVVNVRIDDKRIAQFDNARAAVASATGQ